MSAQVRRRDPFILAGPPFGGYCLPGNPRATFAQTTDPWKRARDRATSAFDERARPVSAELQEPTRRKRSPVGSSQWHSGGPEGNRTPDLFHAKKEIGG